MQTPYPRPQSCMAHGEALIHPACAPHLRASCTEPPGWLGTPWAKPTLRTPICLNPLCGWWTCSREKEFVHSREFYHF